MISKIQSETNEAAAVFAEVVYEVSNGAASTVTSGESLQRIFDLIGSVTSQVDQIAIAAEQQNATTINISESIHSITEIMRGNASESKDSAELIARISSMAGELSIRLNYYAI